jgi:chaperonin GroEL
MQSDRSVLRKEIVNCFSPGQLRLTLDDGSPPRNFDAIVPPEVDYDQQVFHLIDRADKEGWLHELIDTLLAARADKKSFVAKLQPIAGRLAAGHSLNDLPAETVAESSREAVEDILRAQRRTERDFVVRQAIERVLNNIESAHNLVDEKTKLLHGFRTVWNAVKVTFGPKGRMFVISKSDGTSRSTKNGLAIAKSIELEDKLENLGAKIITEAAQKTSDCVGDGTTTTIVLAQALVEEGLKAVADGANPIDLKRELDQALVTVVEILKAASKKVETYFEIVHVATVAADGDKEIGELVCNAIDKIGREGVVVVESNEDQSNSIALVDGIRFDRGYLSPDFITNAEKMVAELDDPYILIHEKKLSSLQPLFPILDSVVQTGKPLLIIAEDVEGEALATLVVNKLRGGLKVAAVKAPGFGDRRKAILEDISILTSGHMISEELGIKLENVSLQMLGRAKRVSIEKEATTIIDGAGERASIDGQTTLIKATGEETSSDYDHEKLSARLLKQSGTICVIRVGGSSEAELKEKRDRTENALNATQRAIVEGIVPGGGITFLNVSKALAGSGDGSDGEQFGIRVMRRALQAPTRQIVENAGLNGANVVEKILEGAAPDAGFNVETKQYGDLVREGIIDPTKVLRVSLLEAVSVAGRLITTDSVIVESSKKDPGSKMEASDKNEIRAVSDQVVSYPQATK